MFFLFEYIRSLTEKTPSPLRKLDHWQPFRIDALGLVTLLGAEEVNNRVGTLQRRRFTEWLPLLAAFVVAGDRFTEEQQGYSLYNITDGIHTTELKGWFTRWVSSQDIRNATSVFSWDRTARPKHSDKIEIVAPLISFIAVVPLLVCTVMMGDWFGVGNSLAIILSILVRKTLLWLRRTALNDMIMQKANTDSSTENRTSAGDMKKAVTSESSLNEEVTLFVTRADGRMVTMYAPREILYTFTRRAPLSPKQKLAYRLTQWLGWTAFGGHIVVLGMSSLFTQIYTVVLLVLSTWAMCHNSNFDNGRKRIQPSYHGSTAWERICLPFTSHMVVTQENPPNEEGVDKRMNAYARVCPTETQEKMLKHWSLMPFEDEKWFAQYRLAKDKHRLKSTTTVSPSSSMSASTDQTLAPTSSFPNG